jgi:hypothetical protein
MAIGPISAASGYFCSHRSDKMSSSSFFIAITCYLPTLLLLCRSRAGGECTIPAQTHPGAIPVARGCGGRGLPLSIPVHEQQQARQPQFPGLQPSRQHHLHIPVPGREDDDEKEERVGMTRMILMIMTRTVTMTTITATIMITMAMMMTVITMRMMMMLMKMMIMTVMGMIVKIMMMTVVMTPLLMCAYFCTHCQSFLSQKVQQKVG